MSIECAFHGFVAADAEAKTSQGGKAWTRLRVGIGKDEDIVDQCRRVWQACPGRC